MLCLPVVIKVMFSDSYSAIIRTEKPVSVSQCEGHIIRFDIGVAHQKCGVENIAGLWVLGNLKNLQGFAWREWSRYSSARQDIDRCARGIRSLQPIFNTRENICRLSDLVNLEVRDLGRKCGDKSAKLRRYLLGDAVDSPIKPG